jgi:hypothetical protein
MPLISIATPAHNAALWVPENIGPNRALTQAIWIVFDLLAALLLEIGR